MVITLNSSSLLINRQILLHVLDKQPFEIHTHNFLVFFIIHLIQTTLAYSLSSLVNRPTPWVIPKQTTRGSHISRNTTGKLTMPPLLREFKRPSDSDFTHYQLTASPPNGRSVHLLCHLSEQPIRSRHGGLAGNCRWVTCDVIEHHISWDMTVSHLHSSMWLDHVVRVEES